MPRGDGSGPASAGARPGRGTGMGAGRGRMGGFGLGAVGACVCPKCGRQVAHQRGGPCTQLTCPDCGTTMTRAR
ncbi:MAG TPA: hypothetical protein DCS43_13355 [Verrucomicrobia bacterium]|nr:hypothetical protein [Verrucomicrobiota bacterium]